MASPDIYHIPLKSLGLSPRTLNSLIRAHLTTVGQVLEMPEEELREIRNFSEKPRGELRAKLAERGITMPGQEGPNPDNEKDF